MWVRKKIGLSPWGGVQPYDDGSPFLGGRWFCFSVYAFMRIIVIPFLRRWQMVLLLDIHLSVVDVHALLGGADAAALQVVVGLVGGRSALADAVDGGGILLEAYCYVVIGEVGGL